MAIILTACSTNEKTNEQESKVTPSIAVETPETGDEAEELIVAYSTEIMDEDQTRIVNGLRRRIAEINEEQDEYQIADLIVTDANSNIEKQIADVETLMQSGVDILFCQPYDADALSSALKEARKAGVTVLINRDFSDTEAYDVYYKADDEAYMGQILKEYMREMLEADPDLHLNMAVVYPTATSGIASFGRVGGMEELAEEMPDRITTIVSGYGNWNTNDTMKLVEDWMQTYDNINYIACANDEEALGAVNVIQSMNLLDEIMVSGANGGGTGTHLCEEGLLEVTIGAKKEIALGMTLDYAIKYRNGEATERVYEAGKDLYFIVTPETVDEWIEYQESFN